DSKRGKPGARVPGRGARRDGARRGHLDTGLGRRLVLRSGRERARVAAEVERDAARGRYVDRGAWRGGRTGCGRVLAARRHVADQLLVVLARDAAAAFRAGV